MSKPDEILERNRKRSKQRAQQGDKPQNATDILERFYMGAFWLIAWGLALVVAAWLFGFSSFVGAIIFGSWINGVILGAVVTFGAGYLVFKAGKYLL